MWTILVRMFSFILCSCYKNASEKRLDIVEFFCEDHPLREQLSKDHLKRIPDLHRICKKLLRRVAMLEVRRTVKCRRRVFLLSTAGLYLSVSSGT